MTCETCQGIGWVCEDHEFSPWDETVEGGCQCNAGLPCGACNPEGELGEQIVATVACTEELKDKVKTWVH